MAAALPLPNPLLHPLSHVRGRFARWWQSRIAPSDVLTLTQRNVYILPTRAGFMLGVTLLALLVACINYQLNLGYLLTFLLAGSAIVGMHVCHGTLRGLNMSLTPPEPKFFGQHGSVRITLNSSRKTTRYGIGLSVLGAKQWSWCDVPAQGMSPIELGFEPGARGYNPVPALTLETRFPLGTFRVWSIWRPAARILVYPSPELNPSPLPPGDPRSAGAAHAQLLPSGEYDGVRSYRRGDPLKQIVWKKSAGQDTLVSRDSQQAQHTELWLDLAQTGGSNLEHRLSRLCAWVLRAEELEQDYGLRLPTGEIAPSHGELHKLRCLEALALC
jgi:uncharacterized protein (DUF58 family)